MRLWQGAAQEPHHAHRRASVRKHAQHPRPVSIRPHHYYLFTFLAINDPINDFTDYAANTLRVYSVDGCYC
jgi:hypothetical protein